MASDTKTAGGNGGRVGRRLLSTAAIFAGALLGSLAILHGYTALPLLLAALLLGVVTLLSFRLIRSEAGWTAPL
ncbi:hypothetical protein [Streptomyces sasae]|uniref:hypothetical protein n=1 Tax=Streptomyces sasae TaxID=1266772 RepID=UPI00292E8B12|nr:hypothetical protein [Streptomyces sasae]